MKKIIILIGLITIIQSCKKERNDYVTFSGKIENTKDTILTITGEDFKKDIVINSDGAFSDTLKINKDGLYKLLKNIDISLIYLKNGFDLKLATDNNSFLESLKYTGHGASSNNCITAYYRLVMRTLRYSNLFSLDRSAFDSEVTAIKYSIDSITSLYKDADSTFLATVDKEYQNMSNFLESNYDAKHKRAEQGTMKGLSKGKPSPKFKNYTNYKGGKSSLDYFKGKYVYIDVWATWCGPCIAEIPALKKIEKQYHDKNIQFVSISIDDERTSGSWEQASSKWREMVADKNLTGVQLHAGEDTGFTQDYQIYGIPRFILIDPDGNIVDANAPRPSNPKLLELFNELGI